MKAKFPISNFNVPFVNMDSYLIRIYRRDKENPEAVIGIIEEIGAEKKQPFKNLSELTTIISNPCVAKAMQGKEGNQAPKAKQEKKLRGKC